MLLRTGRTFTLRRATRARRGLCGHAWVSSRDAGGPSSLFPGLCEVRAFLLHHPSGGQEGARRIQVLP